MAFGNNGDEMTWTVATESNLATISGMEERPYARMENAMPRASSGGCAGSMVSVSGPVPVRVLLSGVVVHILFSLEISSSRVR